MKLIEPLKRTRESPRIAAMVPDLVALSSFAQDDQWRVGIWEHCGQYIIGESRRDEMPEIVILVLTGSEWEAQKNGERLSDNLWFTATERARKLYPKLFFYK